MTQPQPCKAGPGDPTERWTPPQKLDRGATVAQAPVGSHRPPSPSTPAVSDSGQGVLRDTARPGKAVNASGGGASHLQTACRPGRRTRDHAGEGQNRTEENSEERPPWPALSSSPARRNGQGPRGGAGTRTAPGQRGSWDTCVVTCTRTSTRDAARAACPTLPAQLCPGPPIPPAPPPKDTHLPSQRWSVSSAEAPAE